MANYNNSSFIEIITRSERLSLLPILYEVCIDVHGPIKKLSGRQKKLIIKYSFDTVKWKRLFIYLKKWNMNNKWNTMKSTCNTYILKLMVSDIWKLFIVKYCNFCLYESYNVLYFVECHIISNISSISLWKYVNLYHSFPLFNISNKVSF